MSKLWNEMTVEEKLDWLRDRVIYSADVNQVNRVIGNIDRKIQKVANDLELLKRRTESVD